MKKRWGDRMTAQAKHRTILQKLAINLKQNSLAYEKEGYRQATFVSNRFLLDRFLAFCLDTSVMLSTICLWQLLMLFIISNILSIRFLNIIQIVTFGLLIIGAFLFNSFITIKTHGQTIGKYIYHFKVVGKDKHEVSSSKLVLRELIGFALPFVVLCFFFGMLSVFLYWACNFIFVLIHPKHISIIDFLLGTRIVVLKENEEQVEKITQTITQYNSIDLRIHSNFSDEGELNVEEIFQRAKANGVKVLSITDANNAKANFIAERVSKLYQLTYIPGIELDCMYEGKHLRILGYFIDYTSELYAHIENEVLIKEKRASLERVALFERFTGIRLDVDTLLKNNRLQMISAERIVKQVLQNPEYQDNPLLYPYLQGSRKDKPYTNMYLDLFAEGKPCYVAVEYPPLEDIIDVIKLTGGVAILAYTHEILEADATFMHKLIDKGIEGIEVFSPYHSKKQMVQLLRIAKERQIFITSGSNFYGKNRAQVELGNTHCPRDAEYLIEQFVEYAKQMNTE
ncbi:MAG: RDD family protein [Erysipelotrichaceae bacterium]|nr:RDD family protein [Erysipelotrichaceae bacterium]